LKKELKKQIKQDELVTGVEHVASWAQAHPKELRAGAAAVLILGGAAFGIFTFSRSRERAAEEAFASALETFGAPVVSELPPDAPKPSGTVYATAEEKFRKAAAAFDGVERAYPSLPVGQRARYYGALARIEFGDKAGAEKALNEVAAVKGGIGLEPALARLALAGLQRRSGALDKAADAYKQLVEDASFPLPRDQALMDLASTLEQARRTDEARAAYRRLTDEFPESVYAADARRRAEFLTTAKEG
jgi:tetratricopeptide (TPR) repeat protein